MKLTQGIIARESRDEILCVQYSKDDKYLAAGTMAGGIRVYDTDTEKIMSTIEASYAAKAITSLRYIANCL